MKDIIWQKIKINRWKLIQNNYEIALKQKQKKLGLQKEKKVFYKKISKIFDLKLNIILKAFNLIIWKIFYMNHKPIIVCFIFCKNISKVFSIFCK